MLETQNGFTTLMLDWFPIVFHMHEQNEPCRLLLPRKGKTQCLKIIKKVSFDIASEASYVYSGQKFIKNVKKKKGQFGEFFENATFLVIFTQCAAVTHMIQFA